MFFFILKPLLTPSLVSVTQTPTSCSKLGLLKPLTAQPSRTSISETRFDHRNLPTFLMLAISSPMFISIFFEGSEVCQMLNFDILTIFFLETTTHSSRRFLSRSHFHGKSRDSCPSGITYVPT